MTESELIGPPGSFSNFILKKSNLSIFVDGQNPQKIQQQNTVLKPVPRRKVEQDSNIVSQNFTSQETPDFLKK